MRPLFAGVDWAQPPLFVLNKDLALAVFLISMSYLVGKWITTYSNDLPKQLILIKFFGLMGFSMAAIMRLWRCYCSRQSAIRNFSIQQDG